LRVYDGDTLTVGFACTGPVTITATIEGISMVQAPAGAKPLSLTLPCRKGFVEMDYRIAGIDTPELTSSCPTASQRVAEKQLGQKARDTVRQWLNGAQSVVLHDIDLFSEKWGRALGRLEYGDRPSQKSWADWSDHPMHDLGSQLILTGNAVPYNGGRKISFCK
jgi:endonuclease YncB( thermonuclease family)